MYYDVIEGRHMEGYKLELIFENGKRGTVDLQTYTKNGRVFSRFSEMEYFKQFYVNREIGTLCWPDGGRYRARDALSRGNRGAASVMGDDGKSGGLIDKSIRGLGRHSS